MPLVQVSPKKADIPETVVDWSRVPLGVYSASVKSAEDVTGVYKSGRNEGKPYTARDIYLSVVVGDQPAELRARIFSNSNTEMTLLKTFENDPSVHKTTDLTHKKVRIRLARNRNGYLNVSEFYPA